MADGQLEAHAMAEVVQACQHDPALLDRWRDYHLIGEILRSSETVTPALQAQSARVLARVLESLPVQSITASYPLKPGRLTAANVERQPDLERQAANEPGARWKWVVGFASLTAVLAVGWSLVGASWLSDAGPELARAGTQDPSILVVYPEGTIIRDARMESLLAAHKQFGGASALQMPSGFLRNTTLESHAPAPPRSAPDPATTTAPTSAATSAPKPASSGMP
jgi:sigma-E factor negative regulatory protein RseA